MRMVTRAGKVWVRKIARKIVTVSCALLQIAKIGTKDREAIPIRHGHCAGANLKEQDNACLGIHIIIINARVVIKLIRNICSTLTQLLHTSSRHVCATTEIEHLPFLMSKRCN